MRQKRRKIIIFAWVLWIVTLALAKCILKVTCSDVSAFKIKF